MVTTVLGTCKAEAIVGVQRLTSEGNVCQTSTPMARQMVDDLLKVSQLSEEVGAWYERRTSGVAIFTPRVLGKSEVSGIFCGRTAGVENGVLFPRVRARANGEIDGRLVELEEPFVCDENEGDEKCNERIANYRQMMAHRTRKHGVRTVLGLLT